MFALVIALLDVYKRQTLFVSKSKAVITTGDTSRALVPEETTITDTPTENHPIVLVVEDNTDIREYIRSSFTDIYEVITAKDGKEGWELAQARIPNIIVSDIMMQMCIRDRVYILRTTLDD